MTAAVETARHEWEEGTRLLASGRADERHRVQIDVIVAELRRRLGQSFTLAELVAEYADADRWIWTLIDEQAAGPGWTRTLVSVEQAAFHAFSRGALDYTP